MCRGSVTSFAPFTYSLALAAAKELASTKAAQITSRLK
jgi:hypothetical protein